MKYKKMFKLTLVTLIIGSLLINYNLNLNNKGTLRIATYNIYQYYYDGPLDNNNTFEVYLVLKEINADIIGLQESEGKRANDTIKILAELLNMYYVKFSIFNSAQLFGLSFLSKHPILNYDYMYLPSLDATRAIISVTINTPFGNLKVINTHFNAHFNPEIRFKQAQNLLNFTSNYKDVIIVGDFNTGPFETDIAFNQLNNSYNDSWILSGKNWISNEDPFYNPNERIDYIWLKGNYEVLTNSFTVFGTKEASDHVGLYVDIIF